MTKPVLVIMAAGLGSRYGGFKQIAPVDDAGHIIIDYSMYDAYRAGFREVICIISPALEADFTAHFSKMNLDLEIKYAHQELSNLPEGFAVPANREKPWGTAHAILSAAKYVNGPFAVINADDFYGADAYKTMYSFLENQAAPNRHAMVGYHIENTLSETGSVVRGVCVARDRKLVSIKETTDIRPAPNGAQHGEANTFLPAGTPVSMNFWGFDRGILTEFESRFKTFLSANLPTNPLKCEYLLPAVVGELLDEGKITVDVLESVDKWYGVTYAEDMPGVKAAIAEMKASGAYPERLGAGEL
ncbi:MAG: sugar phosphate nucleotidyltransferase [Defluviitaleaceae bacterium]|nr:sugar phosphate nucleotidyltransferase [Defluviitaleaceae bacterium]MCL2275840.1 sugar phosphate nucleotidyltransferase [Defluviitaleaceae bacterium]